MVYLKRRAKISGTSDKVKAAALEKKEVKVALGFCSKILEMAEKE